MTDRLHLLPKHRRALEALLRQHLSDVEVWAYGSRVNGRSHDGSDLDLVLRGPGLKEIPDDWLGDFEEAVRESNIPFLVEARDWARLPKRFHGEIEREYVVLVQGRTHLNKWPMEPLCVLADIRLSSVDKKILLGEHSVRLCNYTDVYYNRFIHSGMEFMNATANDREIGKCALRMDDVVITKDSEKHDDIGIPALIREEIRNLVCGYHLAILRPSKHICGPYLFYALSTTNVQQKFHSYANGITRFGLRKADIGLVELPVPPCSEQRAIAHILGTLDDKIELNRRTNKTLEAMARALFKSWFVDFDPVRAKAAGGDSGLPRPLADLFPARLVQSRLGKTPEGWPVETLADHFEPVKGVSYKGSGLGDDGVPLHNLNSIYEGGGYKYEGIKYYSGEHAERHVVLPGDVIVANTEQGHERLLIGYAAVVPSVYGNYGIASHHIYRVRPRPGSRLKGSYLCFLLNSPQMHDLVSGFANGTTVNMLPLDALQKPLIVCPPGLLIEAFGELAVNVRQRCEELLLESRTLASVRDLLLPKLISGEIRLRDAEKTVETVV